MLKHMVCLFLYPFFLLGSDSHEDAFAKIEMHKGPMLAESRKAKTISSAPIEQEEEPEMCRSESMLVINREEEVAAVAAIEPEKTMVAAQETLCVAINRIREEKLKEYQQGRCLSELAKAEIVDRDGIIPLPTERPERAIGAMQERIQSNKQVADDKIIEMALDVLGLNIKLKPSWQDIQAAYARLNQEADVCQSPASLNKAFLALREFKDRFQRKNSGFSG